MTVIEATLPLVQTPAWAVLERQLIKTMEDAVHPFLAKDTHPDGRLIWRDGLRHSRDGADDFYESFYNWPSDSLYFKSVPKPYNLRIGAARLAHPQHDLIR